VRAPEARTTAGRMPALRVDIYVASSSLLTSLVYNSIVKHI
jgi:hypothetical protein